MRDPYERYLESLGLGVPDERDAELEDEAILDDILVPDGVLRFGMNTETGHIAYAHPDELRFSLHVYGAPGQGKSNALKYLATQIIEQREETGHGMAIIDPHAEVAEHLLRVCMAKGVSPDDVVYFDLRERAWVPVLNPLRPGQGTVKAAHALVEALTRAFGLELMMENPLIAETMLNTAIVLLENRQTLAEAEFFGANTTENLAVRNKMLEQVSYRTVHGFWEEMATLPARDKRIETGSAARRFNFFLLFPAFKRMLGQTMDGIDFEQVMNEGKIAIFNLGLYDTDVTDQGQRFLGSLILDQFKAAAARRQKNVASPFYLFVDEFSRFVSYDTMEALAEARGFGLRLILAHQRLDQLTMKDGQDPRVLKAVMAIPNKLIFGAGLVEDQLALARQAFAPWLDRQKRKLEIWHKIYRPILRKVELTGGTDSLREGTDRDGDRVTFFDQSSSYSEGYVTDHVEEDQLSSVQFDELEDQVFGKMQESIRRGVGDSLFMHGYQEPPQPVRLPEVERLPEGVDSYLENIWAAAPSRRYVHTTWADREIETRRQALIAAASEPKIASSSWSQSRPGGTATSKNLRRGRPPEGKKGNP